MANANVFAQLLAQPVKSVQEYDDERAAREVNRMALQDKRRASALAESTAAQQAGDRNALQRYAGESGGDQNKLIQLLRNSGSAGLMTQADGMENSMLDRRKKVADAGKTDAETLGKHLDAMKFLSTSVMANPSPQNAAMAVDAFERMTGRQMPEERQKLAQLQTPEQVKAWAAGHALQADQLLPKLQSFNAGGAQVQQSVNPLTGAPTETGRTAITQSADSIASQATQRRGQDMTDARTRDANSLTREAGATVYDADRGVLINKATGLARPAATFDGKPVGGKDKALNDTQSKALLFGTRMQESEKAFGAMSDKGVEQRGMLKRTAEGIADVVPFIGDKLADTAGTLTNFTQSPEQQQVEQAQRDWLNAVLRRESGAAIGVSEFANGVKQYFPQPGDSPEVIAQKTKNRQLAARLMLEEVPESRRSAGSAPVKPGSLLKFDATGNLVP